MSQMTSRQTWRCYHPSELTSEQWHRWLNPSNHPSPYLMPEWALLWERIWPRSDARVWVSAGPSGSEIGIATVKRRRFGLHWVFALPYGTPGGWLGPMSDAESRSVRFEKLMTSLSGPRTVQVALTLGFDTPELPKWKIIRLESTTYVLDLRDSSASTFPAELLTSHRRNITKGAGFRPTIEEIQDVAAVTRLLPAWKGPEARRSRIVLQPHVALAFTSLFVPTGAMRWRVAWVEGRPVATVLWLALNNRAVYVDGAVDRTADCPGVNHYLLALMLSDLYSEGIRHFNFGAGPQGSSTSGLARFKEGWGARAAPHVETLYRRPWYHALRSLA